MPVDRGFMNRNRESTQRLRSLIVSLSDEEMQTPVGEHWTVAIALAHLAFWDRRVLALLEAVARDGQVNAPTIDVTVNDISLPLWAAISPREAARIAIVSAEAVDKRLEVLSPALLEVVYAANPHWVVRAAHRNEHLDEVDAALKARRDAGA